MDRHKISLTEANLSVFRGLNDRFPMSHVNALAALHGAGMLPADADGPPERVRTAKGGKQLINRAYRAHAENATQRVVIRQDTSHRDLCDAVEMNDDAPQRLKEARLRAGFKKAVDAARRFGWNEVTYRAHEHGTRDFKKTPGQIEAYAKAFKVEPAWLAFGNRKVSKTHLFVSHADSDHVAALFDHLNFKDGAVSEESLTRRDSPAMNLAAQAAVEALLTELGLSSDEARHLVSIVVQAAEEKPISGVEREMQARVEVVSRLRSSVKAD